MEMKILTFDIEDWFHILDNPNTESEKQWANFDARIDENIDRILEALEKYQKRATFFCLGWIAEKHPDVIKKIDAHGYEIATHSHLHQLVYMQTPEEFRSDLHRSVRTIEDVIGKKVRAYRAPGFSVTAATSWYLEALHEEGIEIDCSIFPAARTHGGFEEFGACEPVRVEHNGITLKEFPINTQPVFGKHIVFSGGGYFRLFPYWMIQHFTKNSKYIMTYFHPRDFDPEQPVLDLPAHRRFKSYVGLKTAFAKFERWIKENDFVDLSEAEKSVDWSSARIINI